MDLKGEELGPSCASGEGTENRVDSKTTPIASPPATTGDSTIAAQDSSSFSTKTTGIDESPNREGVASTIEPTPTGQDIIASEAQVASSESSPSPMEEDSSAFVAEDSSTSPGSGTKPSIVSPDKEIISSTTESTAPTSQGFVASKKQADGPTLSPAQDSSAVAAEDYPTATGADTGAPLALPNNEIASTTESSKATVVVDETRVDRSESTSKRSKLDDPVFMLKENGPSLSQADPEKASVLPIIETPTFEDDSQCSWTPKPLSNSGKGSSSSKRTCRSGRGMILGLAVALLIVAAGTSVALVLIFKKDNSSTSNAGNNSGADGKGTTTTGQPTPASPTDSPPNPATPTPSPEPSIPPPPTSFPTAATLSPTIDPVPTLMMEHFTSISGTEVFQNENSPQSSAMKWMFDNLSRESLFDPQSLEQRYAVLVLHHSLDKSAEPLPNWQLCNWFGIECIGNQVVAVEWARKGYTGSIPSEISLLKYLVTLSLGENEIEGSIPVSLYSISSLKNLYLHKNRLSGELDPAIGQLDLDNLYLGNNQLSGSLPTTLRRKRFRYLILNHNQFSGPLPTELRWNLCWYLDLSHNNFSGALPSDFGYNFGALRHLYLNNNEFEGRIPTSLSAVTGNRMQSLKLNDNKFTGQAPPISGTTVVYHLENNRWTGNLGNNICGFEVLGGGGELVSLKADCSVCNCRYSCRQKCRNTFFRGMP